jgi:hypothetical protein
MAKKLEITPIEPRKITFGIKGISPLIQNGWSEKAVRMLRMTAAERKKVEKVKKNPEEEAHDATHFTENGDYGIPAGAIKKCFINAAHQDMGIPKTLLRKALFIKSGDKYGVIPMECREPVVREDFVRVGQGRTDLRYRPMFDNWSLRVTVELDKSLITVDDLLKIVTRAGFSVGLLEWRPERDGDYGRFEIDTSVQVEEE